jgi:hypothetical protein
MSNIEANIRALLEGGARAALVSADWLTGELIAAPVVDGQSIVNLHTELTAHLDAAPYSDEFLANLRDYCATRLEARALARGTSGGLALATGKGWVITDTRQFHPAAEAAQHQEG